MSFTISTIASLLRSDSVSRDTVDSAARGVGALEASAEAVIPVNVGYEVDVPFGSVTTARAIWISSTQPVDVHLEGVATGFPILEDGILIFVGVEVTAIMLKNNGLSQARVTVRLFGDQDESFGTPPGN